MWAAYTTVIVIVLTAEGASCDNDIVDVRFLLATTQRVQMYSTDPNILVSTITTSNTWVFGLDYHLEQNLVYSSSCTELFKIKLDATTGGSMADPSFVTNISFCKGFAVDWIHNAIFWIDKDTSTLKVTDLDGNFTTTIKELTIQQDVKSMQVDPEVGKLFWLDGGILNWCDLNGENLNTTLSKPGVEVTAFTLGRRRLFYLGKNEHEYKVRTVLYNWHGSSLFSEDEAVQQMKHLIGLSVLGDYLYWMNTIDKVVYRQPLYDFNVNCTAPIENTQENDVLEIKLMGRELQPQSIKTPCQKITCHHVCVPKKRIARCLTPDASEIEKMGHNNKNTLRNVQNISFLLGTSEGVRILTSTENVVISTANFTSNVYKISYHLERNLVYFYSGGALYRYM